MNTKYEIMIKFRDLEDLAYKEEFSTFTSPELYYNITNNKSVINATLLITYHNPIMLS